MSGLVLKLAAGERFIINGALLENGDRPASVRVRDTSARVLRCRDALRPEDVDTPVKRVYFAIQLIVTGDLDEAEVLPALHAECERLHDALSSIDKALVPKLRSMIEQKNYYSALCHLRQMILVESHLLSRFEAPANVSAGAL